MCGSGQCLIGARIVLRHWVGKERKTVFVFEDGNGEEIYLLFEVE
ncbi:hypothetical protein bthur0014_43820 [Bacillus thuringiensis IBL 4222]|nr:hypothetical protein bthur0014_43820 [Bacillus thuringiensis IBL 4222]